MRQHLSLLALSVLIPALGQAQTDNTAKPVEQAKVENSKQGEGLAQYYGNGNTFSSGSACVQDFNRSMRRFNDWSVSAGVGVPLMQSADLTSFNNGNGTPQIGWGAFVSVNKAISHAFGLNLQLDLGESKQGDAKWSSNTGVAAKTKYVGLSLLGDVNLTSLLRRVDNVSNYRWAVHGYAGIGILGYDTYLKIDGVEQGLAGDKGKNLSQPLNQASFFSQAGLGLKYNLSRQFDLEARAMYIMSGDDEFDGGGEHTSTLNNREENNSDNMFFFNIGASWKIGKHPSHLMWHDPLQEIYCKLNEIKPMEVCVKGDRDNDGVCDDWDRELNTPKYARVDGAGVALDVDKDGVIDLYDKCVVVPGPKELDGCPKEEPKVVAGLVAPGVQGDAQKVFEDLSARLRKIQFYVNKDVFYAEYNNDLDKMADILKQFPDVNINIEGHTDVRGDAAKNKALSEKRANAIKKYFVAKGVAATRIVAIGKGESEPINHCTEGVKCSDGEHRTNRRVIITSDKQLIKRVN
jgi:OmpA-OmpF porin, OOP family